MIDADIDKAYMSLALQEARNAYSEGEIPIGAIVVCNGRIVGRGHNLTERLDDVTAHAEMQAITAASTTLGNKYLHDCTLYVTVEPCTMCAGAIGWAQVGRVVVGCADEKRGYTTFVKKSPLHPKTLLTVGVLEDECRDIIQKFFKERR